MRRASADIGVVNDGAVDGAETLQLAAFEIALGLGPSTINDRQAAVLDIEAKTVAGGDRTADGDIDRAGVGEAAARILIVERAAIEDVDRRPADVVQGRVRRDGVVGDVEGRAGHVVELVEAIAEIDLAGDDAVVVDDLVAVAAEDRDAVAAVQRADRAVVVDGVGGSAIDMNARGEQAGAARDDAARSQIDCHAAVAAKTEALRVDAGAVDTRRARLAVEGDMHITTCARAAGALSENGRGSIAGNDDIAGLIDRDRTGLAGAADAARPAEDRMAVDRIAEDAGDTAAAADALREDAVGACAAGLDRTIVDNADIATIAAAAAGTAERRADADIDAGNRDAGFFHAGGKAAIDIAGHAAAAADALGDDCRRAVAEGDDVAVLGDVDVAALAGRAAGAADADRAERADIAVAADTAAAADALRDDAERRRAGGDDVAGVIDGDELAVTAGPSRAADRDLQIFQEAGLALLTIHPAENDSGETRSAGTDMAVAAHAAAAADALRDDA